MNDKLSDTKEYGIDADKYFDDGSVGRNHHCLSGCSILSTTVV
jgi:hypothetical protein